MQHPAASIPPAAAIPAGFWRRWCAGFVDHVLLIVACLLALKFALGGPGSYPSTATLEFARRAGLVGYFLLAALYFTGMESSALQATPGKRLFGIKVVDASGARLGTKPALTRWFAGALSWLSLGLGYALPDFVTGTRVVDRWAHTDSPERQRTASLVQKCFGITTLMFTLALPIVFSQYSDYVVRSQVSEGLSLADSVKTTMEDYRRGHGTWPEANLQAGLSTNIHAMYVRSVDVGPRPGRITIVYSSRAPQSAHRSLDGRRLYFDARIAGTDVEWECHSEDLRQADCPRSCNCSW